MTISLDELGIPPVGLGLWKMAPEDTATVVVEAMKEGYRHRPGEDRHDTMATRHRLFGHTI